MNIVSGSNFLKILEGIGAGQGPGEECHRVN